MNSGNDSNEFPPGEGAANPNAGNPNVGSASAEGADATLSMGRPAVASAPGKMAFAMLFAAIFIFIIVRSLFFSDKAPPPEITHRKERVPAENGKMGGGEISISPGTLPQPPSEFASQTPAPPPLPPPPPALLTPPSPELHAGSATDEALARRIRSPMFIVSGAGAVQQAAIARRKAAVSGGNDPNVAFADSVAGSTAEEAVATKVSHLDTTIVQGKLIHAVLETAIDSALPGPIRAIVSHDVYAEAGRDILIPKGSRMIGLYNAQVKKGQGRVFIIWNRVIRPDGVDIDIESPGIDLLGRAGMAGDLDNKYFEMFSTAILTSSMDIAIAAAGQALFGNEQQTTTQGGGGTTTTSSPTATAMQQAVSNIGSIGSAITNSVLNIQPEITIDQGAPIDVFVNRDLKFPRDVTGAAGGFIN